MCIWGGGGKGEAWAGGAELGWCVAAGQAGPSEGEEESARQGGSTAVYCTEIQGAMHARGTEAASGERVSQVVGYGQNQ